MNAWPLGAGVILLLTCSQALNSLATEDVEAKSARIFAMGGLTYLYEDYKLSCSRRTLISPDQLIKVLAFHRITFQRLRKVRIRNCAVILVFTVQDEASQPNITWTYPRVFLCGVG